MARLSIRQGPVKVAQRHRSERYPENPLLPSADDWTSTIYFPRCLPILSETTRFTFTRCRHIGLVYQSDHHYAGHSWQNVSIISGPPSDFWSPPPFSSTSWQAASAHSCRRINPRRFPQYRSDTDHFGCSGCLKETHLTISSNVLSSISGSMLTIPPETRSENGNPALRRRPAKAETSFTSLNHTALVGQCQREGWGMVTPI